jgi:hypothetical protein
MLSTARQCTPAAGMKFSAQVRFNIDNLDNNICFGFANANTDPLANFAALTDLVAWSHTLNATDGVLTPSVDGDDVGTSAGTALAAMTASRDIVLGITFKLNATACTGFFWYHLGSASGLEGNEKTTRVEFTTTQKARLLSWLTTAPTNICGFFQARASTANARNTVIQYLDFSVDRVS